MAGCSGEINNPQSLDKNPTGAEAVNLVQSTQGAIPPASQLVDSNKNIWTLSNGVVLENGAAAGYSANVILLVYYNGVISQENNAGGWWSWTGTTWNQIPGDPRPKVSASGTTIPSASQIIDSQNNVWTLSSGVVLENGKDAGYSANVILLLYYNGVISQENNAGGWWSWTGTTWNQISGDPRGASPTPTPTATPKPTPTPTPTATPKPTPTPTPTPHTSPPTTATQVFNYPNGFANMGNAIALTGRAGLSGSTIQFTTPSMVHAASGVWYATRQDITSFTTDFTFSIANGNAMGITFVVQNSNASTQNPYYGHWGTLASADANGMGYGAYPPPINPLGTAIYNSIAIAFDPRGQQGVGGQSLTALYIEGAPWNPMVPEQDLAPFGVILASGHKMSAHVVYDGKILTMVLQDTTTLAQARYQWPVNIPVLMAGSGIPPVGTGSSNLAWVGFDGSTVEGEYQSLYTWDFYEGYNTRLATPTFSLASGQYSGTQTVTISGPAGASIYYTTNGLLPTSSSTPYTGPITVSTNAAIQAVAIQSGFTDSYIGSATYQINTPNVINFPRGFNGTGVGLSGSAALSGSHIRLTNTNSQGVEAGAAWFGVPVNVATFSTAFTLQFTDAIANGMTFCIQNESPGNVYVANSLISGGPGSLGSNQSGMGYGGLMSSVAIAFDLYNNPNSVGLYTNGAFPTGSQIGTGLSFGSGHPFNVSLKYDGTTLAMTMTDTVTNASFSRSWAINIPSTVRGNTAYVGFTGATGGLTANQDVVSWTYSTATPKPTPTPTPTPTATPKPTPTPTPKPTPTPTPTPSGLGATTIFNCPSFTSTGACGASANSGSQTFFLGDGAQLPSSPGPVTLIPTGAFHTPGLLLSQSRINVQAFNTTFTFIPNGSNISFFAENENNNPGYDGADYSGGAGCEGGFYQAYGSTAPPNNSFAVMLDSYDSITAGGGTFTYSSTQWYQSGQSPCNPNSGPNYWPTNKIPTTSVPLNSPATAPGTTTGDTYSLNLVYDGSTLTENLFDITAGGSCPGTSCFTHSWTNVFIPSIVGGTSAYVGIIGAVGLTPIAPLVLKSFVYTVETPTGTATPVAYNANTTTNNGTVSAASPTYNVAGGSYNTPQTITISDTTPGAYICYVVATSTPTFYPQPTNNNTSSNSNLACNKGTLYTGPVTISSTSTLYAVAGTNLGGGPPSPLTAATYTIGTSSASTLGLILWRITELESFLLRE